MKNRVVRVLFFVFLCSLVLFIKMSSFHGDYEKVLEHSESDLNHYMRLSRSFLGEDTHEGGRTYQYPPLYPLFILPGLFVDTTAFILLSNIILCVLALVPLTLILRRFTGFYHSSLIAVFVVIFNFIFSIKSYGYPMIFSSVLFAWFFYFAYCHPKRFFPASLCFCLLVLTKYVFLFMIPVLLFYYRKRIVLFLIPSFTCLGLWILRNIFLHGSSLWGMVGGYSSVFTGDAFYMHMVGSKVVSIATALESNLVMMYYFIFFITVLYSMKKGKIYEQYREMFHQMILHSVVFFAVSILVYDQWYMNWRYLSYFTPVYLALSVALLTRSAWQEIQGKLLQWLERVGIPV